MTFSIIAHYFKLSVVMLSVIMLNFVMLSVVKLKIVMLSVVKLKVAIKSKTYHGPYEKYNSPFKCSSFHAESRGPSVFTPKNFYKIDRSCILQFSLMPERNDLAYAVMT